MVVNGTNVTPESMTCVDDKTVIPLSSKLSVVVEIAFQLPDGELISNSTQIVVFNCPAGTHSNATHQCQECAQGTYQPLYGQSECLECPQNSISSSGANSSVACQCAQGFYWVAPECVSCHQVWADREYVCKGNNSAHPCKTGYTGQLCLSCEHDSYPILGYCFSTLLPMLRMMEPTQNTHLLVRAVLC